MKQRTKLCITGTVLGAFGMATYLSLNPNKDTQHPVLETFQQVESCYSVIDLNGVVGDHDLFTYHRALQEVGKTLSPHVIDSFRTSCRGADAYVFVPSQPGIQDFDAYHVYYTNPYAQKDMVVNGLTTVIDSSATAMQQLERGEIPGATYTLLRDKNADGMLDDVFFIDAVFEGKPGCTYLDAGRVGALYYKSTGLFTNDVHTDKLQEMFNSAIVHASHASIDCTKD